MTRVCSDEVEYIGWKSYGRLTQLVPVGSYWTWPNPLAALAVIDPFCPVVWSLMAACSPFGVSFRDTFRLSPEFMNRSLGLGVNVAVVEFTGFGVAVGRPFLVTNAKLTYSGLPILARQVAFWMVPATGSWARLKMFMAAHHLVGSQALAPIATCQVGQGTHPGG